jgi:hypothetical protein
VETPIRVLAIPQGYSKFANVFKVSPVFSKNEKGPPPKKRGTKVLRTELEQSIQEPSARK